MLPPRSAWTLRAAVACLVTSLCLSCSSTPRSAPLTQRRPPPEAALRGDWLGGSSSLRREHFERLLDVASQDPAAIALLEKSAVTLKRRNVADLFGLLSLCPEGGAEDAGGHTFFDYDLGVFSIDLETLASGKPSAQVQAQFEQVTSAPQLMRWTRQDFPDYVLVRRTMVPRICLVRTMDVVSAYETLLHELTHATLRDPHFALKKTSEVDEATFLEQFVQAPGDEVDAYVAGTRARIRVDKGRARVHKQFARFFDDQGNLTAARLLVARAILAPPPAGLGYAATSLRDARAKSHEAEVAELNARLRVVEATLSMRREQQRVLGKNAEVHAHNVSAFRQQAEVARQRGDAQAQREALAKADEAARQAAEVRQQLPIAEASLKRLELEAARLKQASP